MSSARRPSKTESRLDYEVNQTSHGFSVGTILTHTGSAYAAALSTDEIVGVVSEVQDTNNFTVQTHGRITGLSSLTAGSQYYVSSSSAGTATTTDTDTAIYVAVSTTEAIINTYIEGAGGGGSQDLVLISTAAASNSASIEFTGLDNTYTNYIVEILNMRCQTNDTQLRLILGTGAGPTYQTSGYTYAIHVYSHISDGVGGGSSQAFLGLAYPGGTAGQSNSGTAAYSGTIRVYDPSDSAEATRVNGVGNYNRADGNPSGFSIGGHWPTTTAITALKFEMSSGNMVSGTFKLYGIK